jgi:tripartite-type tricarboxylate transporter receptor subunit TctC
MRKEKKMGLLTRVWLVLGLVLGISYASSPSAWSQDKYPSRPIELVIAFPPGGFADVTGRIFAEEMSKLLSTPIAPINKGGATGSVAATGMLRSPKDGYSLLVNTLGGMVLAPVILKDVAYDTNKDFYPVAFITSAPDGLTVRAESPYKTLHELIEAAKKNPNKLSYATAGTGVGGHFNSLILAQSAGIKIKHVPYKGGGEYVPALLGGHLDFVIGTAIATLPHESAGKLRTLTLMGANKMKGLPTVPTTVELGIKGDYLDSWAGCFVTAGTPKPVIDTLTAAAEKVIKSKDFSARIEKTGGVVQYIAPAEFRKMIDKDRNTAIEVAKKEGLLQSAK